MKSKHKKMKTGNVFQNLWEFARQQLKDREKAAFCVLFFIMAAYYGFRMFALTPWYDELYTYYYFISRGPVYAAIHWPLPNNHVGYSVLSAFLDFFGNPYIGLRGVSYVCALANLALLFAIGRRFFVKGLSLAAVFLYAAVGLVNQLAVQGRGYTLGVTCYLLAFLCLISICQRPKRRHYVLYALSLTLGLYTLTSDIYWVLSLCLAGGFCLLYQQSREKKRAVRAGEQGAARRLFKLILSSLAGAVMTTGLYGIIWLAIGSNLLVKESGGPYFGMGHVEMILQAPFQAIGAGMEYMLATPYIQSVERAGFLPKLYDWFLSLFGLYFGGLEKIVFILFTAGGLFLIFCLFQRLRSKKEEEVLLPLFLLSGIVCTPVFLILQCTLPYYRVFAYGGVLLSLLLCFLAQELLKRFDPEQKGGWLAAGAALLLACYYFFFTPYHEQYGRREYLLQDALEQSRIKEAERICVTDCTQQYLIRFLYDIICENTQVEGADFLLLDKKMLDPSYEEMEWEFYHYYDTIPWDYVNEKLSVVYENEGFVLYEK